MKKMETTVPLNNVASTTTFDDLSPETAVDILSRLPVKTLIISTSVSKTWYSLITDHPSFISAQLLQSCCNENAVFKIPVKLQKNYSVISAKTGHVLDKYQIPFYTRTDTLQLVCSLNGVLCLSDQTGSDYDDYQCLYLWNPSVRKCKLLASSCFKKRDECCFYGVGLGFYEPSRDLRIVRVMYRMDDEGCMFGKLGPKVEVFSLRVNKWRRIKNPRVCRVGLDSGTSVGSKVYWVDTGRCRSFLEEVWILSFDFNAEVFGEIKLPDDVRYCLGESAGFKLMKFEGSLSVFFFDYITESNGILCQPCCLWLMKRDEDGMVSWNVRFKVVLKEHVWPLGFTKGGTLLMVSLSRPITGLLSCNLKSEQDLRLGEPLSIGPCSVDTSFMESLLMFEGGDVLDPYESPGG